MDALIGQCVYGISKDRRMIVVYEPALRIVRYVERYFQRHDRTEFPTVRQVARAVRLRQQEVWDIAEAEDDLMLTAYYTVPPQPQGQWFVETL